MSHEHGKSEEPSDASQPLGKPPIKSPISASAPKGGTTLDQAQPHSKSMGAEPARDSAEPDFSTPLSQASARQSWWPQGIKTAEWIMIAFTAVTAFASWAGVWVANGQLREMQSSAADTAKLVDATQALASAGQAQSVSGQLQAAATDKLKVAGEAQARSMASLQAAGEAQAVSTEHLAESSAAQLGAIRDTANATKLAAEAATVQSAALRQQAGATVLSSLATDRLASAGTAQSAAVLKSLEVAREANSISLNASRLADRPWLGASIPTNLVPTALQEYAFNVNVSNTGKSPAINSNSNSSIEIYDFPFQTSILEPCAGSCPTITMFPGSATTYKVKISAAQMTPEIVSRINSGITTIVLRSRVDYSDQFGNKHYTLTCSYYVKDLGFTWCRGGNDAN